MRTPKGEEERRLIGFRDACRKAGARLTPQRLGIFRAVAATDEHPDAEIVFRRVRETMPDVSMDTVYRTLWTLVDLRVIGTMGPPREKTRFDADMKPHHHFVCTSCGAAFDFEDPAVDRIGAPRAARAFGEVERTVVEFRGVCVRCAGKR